MKSEKLLRALTGLPDELVEEAAQRRRHPLTRLAALAACLVMVAVALCPFLRYALPHGDGGVPPATEDNGGAASRPHPGIAYQGAVYQLWDEGNTAAADRLALPQTIPDNLVGSRLDTLPDYGTVYAYAPLEGRTGHSPAALYLLQRENGSWQYMILAGFPDSACVEGDALLQFYGAASAGDIRSLHPTGKEDRLMDPQTFFDALTAAPALGSQDFYRTVFGDVDWEDEEAWEAAESKAFAGSALLRLETTAGVVSYMTYYPAIGYIEWIQGYYAVGELTIP